MATVGAVLWAREGSPPDLDRVQEAALPVRRQLWEQAYRAQDALGQPASLISTAEADLRVFAHDALHPHHDKDLRSFAVFPVAFLQGVRLQIWIVDHTGYLKQMTIHPGGDDPGALDAYVVLHRGHVRTLAPGSSPSG